MNRKVLSFLVALAVVFSFSACNKDLPETVEANDVEVGLKATIKVAAVVTDATWADFNALPASSEFKNNSVIAKGVTFKQGQEQLVFTAEAAIGTYTVLGINNNSAKAIVSSWTVVHKGGAAIYELVDITKQAKYRYADFTAPKKSFNVTFVTADGKEEIIGSVEALYMLPDNNTLHHSDIMNQLPEAWANWTNMFGVPACWIVDEFGNKGDGRVFTILKGGHVMANAGWQQDWIGLGGGYQLVDDITVTVFTKECTGVCCVPPTFSGNLIVVSPNNCPNIQVNYAVNGFNWGPKSGTLYTGPICLYEYHLATGATPGGMNIQVTRNSPWGTVAGSSKQFFPGWDGVNDVVVTYNCGVCEVCKPAFSLTVKLPDASGDWHVYVRQSDNWMHNVPGATPGFNGDTFTTNKSAMLPVGEEPKAGYVHVRIIYHPTGEIRLMHLEWDGVSALEFDFVNGGWWQ